MFIPLDWIIGGPAKAGKGWGMLMECLAAGRAISLPSTATGGSKVAMFASGAYARIRTQFNLSIGRFEGIEEPLARMAAYTYIADATRTFSTAAIDAGAKPSVASAIAKYHVTELGRKIGLDAMDIQGGKGICLGPNNYLGRSYQAAPIGITVEGANILTRNMIIFGQGVIRCHPYILPEMEAANLIDEKSAQINFDKAFFQHIGYILSNFTRTFVLGLTGSYFVSAPAGKMKRYYQQGTRFSAALAFISDVCMAIYGSSLKRKESISARLGDILSYLYMLSAVLKQYHDQGENAEDLPIVRYAALHCLFEIQERFDQILKNLPNRTLAWILKVIIFPIGERFSEPRDSIMHEVAALMISPTASRARLAAGMYLSTKKDTPLNDLETALMKTIEMEPIDKMIKSAAKAGEIQGYTLDELAKAALAKGLITNAQYAMFVDADEARMKVIAVDDFSNKELAQHTYATVLQSDKENQSS
jgi:acyl-CoA dehydrogenase